MAAAIFTDSVGPLARSLPLSVNFLNTELARFAASFEGSSATGSSMLAPDSCTSTLVDPPTN